MSLYEFQVILLTPEGTLEVFPVVSSSLTHARAYVTKHLNENQIYDAKIIKIEKVNQDA